MIHSAVLKLLVPSREKVHFIDWTYKHHTIINGEVQWGGIQQGTNDSEWKRVKEDYLYEASLFSI